MGERTTNYGLTLWEPEDSFLRADFNEDNAKIEEALNGMAASMPRIVTGTYSGTGTYGSGSKNTLNLGFRPRLVIITGFNSGTAAVGGFFVSPASAGQGGGGAVTVIWSDTGVSWYGNSAAIQLNMSGNGYAYIAIQ